MIVFWSAPLMNADLPLSFRPRRNILILSSAGSAPARQPRTHGPLDPRGRYQSSHTQIMLLARFTVIVLIAYLTERAPKRHYVRNQSPSKLWLKKAITRRSYSSGCASSPFV